MTASLTKRPFANHFDGELRARRCHSASITANQTPALLKRYFTGFPTELANVGVIQRVLLMTPENIHLNSCMYEPGLDMSDLHLRRLFAEVVALV